MDYDLLQPHYWLELVIVDNILYPLGGSIKDGAFPSSIYCSTGRCQDTS